MWTSLQTDRWQKYIVAYRSAFANKKWKDFWRRRKKYFLIDIRSLHLKPRLICPAPWISLLVALFFGICTFLYNFLHGPHALQGDVGKVSQFFREDFYKFEMFCYWPWVYLVPRNGEFLLFYYPTENLITYLYILS